ncbi:hypothetical protein AUR67_07775 [Pseudoalteromonas sp. XI10]|uniref:TerB family tellurite resistance protein n=1 Tax=Pseudoalteromonas sp. XI10 TaxID=1766621 RepID=UPI000733488A|nr:TerB family tellurite resistance protein [Pseudoalteromonas sp. XI10]KTG21228.1 hypothetical protein AUR67_07775 [Pseudoalteromonas sp. XI10]
MDFDILDVINEATKEADAFEGHPAADFTIEEKLLYLNGLALVMNADGHIDDTEKEYIRILIKSMNLDESTLDDMVTFAKAPDKDTIQAFFRTFRRRPISQLFLFDALMMTRRDGKVEDKEKAVVDKIADQLEILKGTQQDIFDLFCHIKNRNWQESALYFSCHLLNPDHFKHLLAYHEVEFDALMTETAETRSNRLLDIMKSKLVDSLEWGTFACEGTSQKASLITKEPITLLKAIASSISCSVVMPWLQRMLDRGELRVTKETVYLVQEPEEKVLFEFSNSFFKYEQEANAFYLGSLDYAQKSIGSGEILHAFLRHTNLNYLIEQNDLNNLLILTDSIDVAVSNAGHLPTCDGVQVSAITSGYYFANQGHPNAINEIKGDQVEIRYCNHCSGGHGTQSGICDDKDRRFTKITLSEMLTEHGFYLVK